MTGGGTGPSKIWTDLDLDAEGKQSGYFRLPLAVHDRSGDDAGYGFEPIPVVTIRNGEGPGVLLMAGNHGNEYEGQILLMKLIRSLRVEDVQGRIIILPAANAPAVRADQRISPLDDGNLNRLFPGSPGGSPTAMIAHLIESHLLPRVQYAFDFHSGSSTMEYLPCAVVARSENAGRFSHSLDYLRAFGLPGSMIIDHSTGGDGALIGACRRAGVYHLSTELGGGGTVARTALRLAEEGLTRLLHHVGVLKPATSRDEIPPSRLLHRLRSQDYIFAANTERGLFEPFVGLGDEIKTGQTAGQIHFTTAPWRGPEPVMATAGGVVVCRRIPARTGPGDCVFVIAREVSDPASLFSSAEETQS